MIISFGDKNTEDLYNGTRRVFRLPSELIKVALRKLDTLNATPMLQDFRIPPGNKLEKLSGKYTGFYSIRINDKYRIIFQWKENNAYEVSIIDYH